MNITKEAFANDLAEELTNRGYDDCQVINNPWLPTSVTYTDAFGCQYTVMYDDEQMDIVIMVNHICDGDESEMLQQMIICNNFNSESRYARFSCNESGGIIVCAEISCVTENLVQVCSDIFEIVSTEVSALIDYFDSE